MHRLLGLACVCFACSYNSPAIEMPVDANEPRLDGPPITSCTPNETFCNGRDRVTCNAAGNGLDAALTVTCPLTCLDTTAQCFSASHLSDADQLACAGNPPTFMPVGDVLIDMNNGLPRITCQDGGCGPAVSDIVGTLVTQLGGGPQIAMFCLRQIMIPDVNIDVSGVPHPIALFSLLDVVIDGDIDVSGGDAAVLTPGSFGPGGGGGGDVEFIVDNRPGEAGGGQCPGQGGNHTGMGPNGAGGGGGGGGNLDIGGSGGRGQAQNNGGTATGGAGGDASCAAATFLAGGGGGGSGGDGPCGGPCGAGGGGGGGALLIASGGNLQQNVNSQISADGGDGFISTSAGGGGGGAGGTIVLEGKGVLLGGTFRLRGGNGGSTNAGNGGGGADTTDLSGDNGANESGSSEGGAGGGGGAGRLLLRLPADASALCTPVMSQPENVCTPGTLRTFPP